MSAVVAVRVEDKARGHFAARGGCGGVDGFAVAVGVGEGGDEVLVSFFEG